LSRALYGRGQTALLVKEAHIVASQGQTPRYAQVLVTGARSNANDLIMVTQRVQNLDTTMASQANIRVAFKMTDPNDLKRINVLPEPRG
jgi:DNA helicase HerA-like ATPase